ncbi:MAG: heat shock protein GrpE [Alphaproteobacteria bacterium ADurb.Bin438]|nr:MAG: heat shock protein GrpE [Alphaproteobacteria bacterium ADurb.Bin438]
MSKNKKDINKETEELNETEIAENEEVVEEITEEQVEAKESEVVNALKEEVAKYKDAYVRSVADFENYKKRANQEIEKTNKFAVTNFARDVLNIADSLSRALKSMPPEENRHEQLKNFAIGAEMTLSELHSTLSKHKIEQIKSIGEIFNPNFHKVIQEREDENLPNGTIIEEWQTGYMIADRVLREAMVIVSKKVQKNETHIDTNA